MMKYGVPALSAQLPPMKSIWEKQAEIYMQGLHAQATEFEARLKSDEELEMVCYQGMERLSVIQLSMPSDNVVALRCLDSNGGSVQITGHMNAITFSFRVIKPSAPVKRNKIGFELPSD